MIKPLLLTMGEPTGIAPEITIKAWRLRREQALLPFCVVSDPQLYADDVPVKVIDNPAQAIDYFDDALPVVPLLGKVGNAHENARLTIESIERGASLCLSGQADGLVTNPIQKSFLKEAGFAFPGHTEFLAHLCGGETLKPVMMLATQALRVVPLTIHIPLSEVAQNITQESIVETARIILKGLKEDFGIQAPRLAVAGLNPHAGENGQFGNEDINIIMPAIKSLQADGHLVTGPHSADTLFHEEARQNYDAALCMYHDQALIPLKTLDFHGGVNITLGLPFVRTSPDHGTALDIAGQGIARPDSLMAAILKAQEIVVTRA